ncbi:MAG: metallophosphoesterase [Chloroflexota bacterium]
MTFPRLKHIPDGLAMVVTDLHGTGDVFDTVIDTFHDLHAAGQVDRLVMCGDLIHGYGSAKDDASLRMINEVIDLQDELGADTVIMLMGNHEMPHVYSITLSKGTLEFTGRFEHALSKSGHRDRVMRFLTDLPIYASTNAGVLITHAGATPAVTTPDEAENILTFDHDALLQLADDRIRNASDLDALKSDKNYLRQAKHYLAISGIDDPRYTHLLRGQILSHGEDQFEFLWDVLFSYNERGYTLSAYEIILQHFLESISVHAPTEQRVVVAGHISVQGGHNVVTKQQLRLASYAHATPKSAGQILLLDCAKPVETASDLVPMLRPTL